MEDVAAAAGVSAATAYNHFPSKHALVGHVYGPMIRPLQVQAERDVAAGRPVVEALCDQVAALARLSSRYRTLTVAFWSAVQEYTIKVVAAPDPDDDTDPRTLAPVPQSINTLVEHGQCTGQLREFPAASEVSGMIVNLLFLRAISRPDETAETTTELLLTAMFGMLAPELVAGAEARPFAAPVDIGRDRAASPVRRVSGAAG